MKRAFVTGSTGYIGRCLVKALRLRGVFVTMLVRQRESRESDPERPASTTWAREVNELEENAATVRGGHADVGTLPFYGDLFSPIDSLAEAMRDQDVVFHLAAAVSFAPSSRNELFRVNGEGTRRVLEAARRSNVGRVVVVSSACTVGLSAEAASVLDEDAPFDDRLAERNPYLASKRETELHALAASRNGQYVVIVNPTTVFGPGDRTLNSGTMFRQIARARVLPVPPGGTNVVDVTDVAEGLIAAAERGRSGRRYILGGRNVAFAELFGEIADLIGRSPVFVRVGGLARWPLRGVAWAVQHMSGSRIITPQIVDDTFAFKFYSSARAARELDWSPRSSLRQTLAAAWDYYRTEGLIAPPLGDAA